jgi:hypothetical protein
MHVERNVCERLLRTLLNTDGKTRDNGHARADLKKIGIRLELWLDDSVKGTLLPTSCITLSKHVKKAYRLLSMGMLLVLARGVPVGTHTRMYVCKWAHSGPDARSTAWSSFCLRSSKPLDYCRFKSWSSLLLVGEV